MCLHQDLFCFILQSDVLAYARLQFCLSKSDVLAKLGFNLLSQSDVLAYAQLQFRIAKVMLSAGEQIIRLVLALLVGSLVGLEREVSHKPAGLRTHALISLASALFTMLSISSAFGGGVADPTRIASQILTGMGFVGAGVIISTGGQVKGVTTAATLWITAAMGMAIGLGEYLLAAAATGLTLLTLLLLRVLEKLLDRQE